MINSLFESGKTIQEIQAELEVSWATGLPFVYVLKNGRDGEYNRGLIICRRKENKTVVWSSVMLAFKNAVKLQEENHFAKLGINGYQEKATITDLLRFKK